MREVISVAISSHQWKCLPHQWSSAEVPPSSVVISGSASEEFARDRPSRRLSFVRGLGFVRGGVRERVWVRDWNSRADAKVEAGGSDDKLRDVALRHVRGHLMRGAISGHERSSAVISGPQRSFAAGAGPPPRRNGSRDGRGHERSSGVMRGPQRSSVACTLTQWLTRWPRMTRCWTTHVCTRSVARAFSDVTRFARRGQSCTTCRASSWSR